MKSLSNVERDLLDIRDDAVQARHFIDKVISDIDTYLDAHSIDDMIIYLRSKGCTYSQIAEKTGVSTTTVLKKCKRYEANRDCEKEWIQDDDN